MSIHTRRSLFYFLLFLFLIISSVLIAYSLGLKPDFKNLSFEETGGIYLRSEPPDTLIFLDGQSVKNQSGILQSGTLIDDLREDTYRIVLKRDGYFDWEKQILIEPALVQVFDRIVMVPKKDPERVEIAVNKFTIVDGSIVLESVNGLTVRENKLLGTSLEDSSEDGTIITYNKTSKNYYLSNIFNLDTSLNINTIFNNLKESRLGLEGIVPVVKASIHPFNHKKLIIQSKGALYSLDTSRLTIEQITEGPVDFKVGEEEVVFYNKEAFYRYNLIFRTTSKITELDGKEIKDWAIAPNGIIVLYGNGELLSINGSEEIKIAYKATLFSTSRNSRSVAFLDYDGPLYVYRFAKEEYVELLTGINEPVKSLNWYKDNEHLFVETDNLYFVEIDDRTPLNTVRLASQILQYDYKPLENALYFMNENGVFRYEI